MGPKPDKKAAKDVVVDGVNVAALNDNQLLEFQRKLNEKFATRERENALLEVELNMMRNAWLTTENKIADLEMENFLIGAELDMGKKYDIPSEEFNSTKDLNRGKIYEQIKKGLFAVNKLENLTTFDGFLDPESKNAVELRYRADKKDLVKNKKLKSKKANLEKKVGELKKIQEELQAKAEEETEMLTDEQLEEIALKMDNISTDTGSDISDHSVMDRQNVIDEALCLYQTSKRKKLDPEQQELRNLTLLEERKLKKRDPRYDDERVCSSEEVDSEVDHIFDDYNPFFDEDVDDAVNYYQMEKWLTYDYDTLVNEMKNRMDKRLEAINYVWTKDVKNVLCSQLDAISEYNENLKRDINERLEKEAERKRKNEEHLKLILEGLETVRRQMIRERHASNMYVAQQQAEEWNYLIQESYDKAINDLKSSSNFNFILTQMFFMRSTENDINLVHQLHGEQQRVERSVQELKAEVENAKKELAKMEGPLEEEEKAMKWMETAMAALQKEMRSKKGQERTNAQLTSNTEKLESETTSLQYTNLKLNTELSTLQIKYGEIVEFFENFGKDNAFKRILNRKYNNNTQKIENLKDKVRRRFGTNESDWQMLKRQVLRDVERAKKKKQHDLLEKKAFNELVSQFDLSAKEYQISGFHSIDKFSVPYRRTSANLITTFHDSLKMKFPFKRANTREEKKFGKNE